MARFASELTPPTSLRPDIHPPPSFSTARCRPVLRAWCKAAGRDYLYVRIFHDIVRQINYK